MSTSTPIQNYRSVLRRYSLLGRLRSSLPERSLATASSQPGALPKNEYHSNSGSLFLGQSTRLSSPDKMQSEHDSANTMKPKTRFHGLWSVFLLGFWACGGSVAKSSDTSFKYKEALVKNDPKTAYDLLSNNTKQNISYAVFLRTWNNNKEERAFQASRIDPERNKETLYVSGDHLLLALSNVPKRWAIEGISVQGQGGTSIKATLFSFHYQLNQATIKPLLNLLTPAKSAPLAKELQDFKQGLATSLKDNVAIHRIDESNANYRFSTQRRRYKIALTKLPNDTWAIADINFLPSVTPLSVP